MSALAVPDLLSGVIAVDGALPLVPGWDPPLAPLDHLPILLVGDLEATKGHPSLQSTDLARQLDLWGGRTAYVSPEIELDREQSIRAWLAAQSPRTGYPPAVQ